MASRKFTDEEIRIYIDRNLAGETLFKMGKDEGFSSTWLSQLMRQKFGYSVKERAFTNKPPAYSEDTQYEKIWNSILYSKPLRLIQ